MADITADWLSTPGLKIVEPTAGGAALVAFTEPDVADLLPEALAHHREDAVANRLTIVVAPADAPTRHEREDGDVRSFVASGPWTGDLLRHRAEPARLCYHALRRALAGDSDAPVLQIASGQRPAEASPNASSVEAVVPHRGAAAHLRACVAGLLAQTLPCFITACLDQPVDSETRAILKSDPRIDAYLVSDPPQGPYVIRQHFAMASSRDFLSWQDSDDFVLPSQLAELIDEAIRTDADIVGSHELRLDEIARAVRAVRYPLDVSAAFANGPMHALLFPTTIVRTSFFKTSGGLSTDMRFGLDLEFLFRAHFTARMRNVDRFLYVRRLRAGSLTTTPATALWSPARIKLNRGLIRDFTRVQRGELALGESVLARRETAHIPAFDRL